MAKKNKSIENEVSRQFNPQKPGENPLQDVLDPEERIRQYNDIEKCIRVIAKNVRLYPKQFPKGHTIEDKTTGFSITILSDEKGNYGYMETDHEEIDMVLKELIKEADHYLVMAHNCRWNGVSGYKIVGSRKETVYRNDDVCICPQRASKGGKTLICRESSHDVPMGARTSIIALTNKEYAILENAEWDTVAKFADKCESRA